MASSIRSSVSCRKRPLKALYKKDLDQLGLATLTPSTLTLNPTIIESIKYNEITNLKEENLIYNILRGTLKEEWFITLTD